MQIERRAPTTANKNPSAIAGLIGKMLLYAALGLAVYGVWVTYSVARVVDGWTPVRATVIASQIQDRRSHGNIQLSKTPNYFATLTFRYTVDGHPYLSSTSPDHSTSWRSEKNMWQQEFAVGRECEIRYKPGDPTVISPVSANLISFFYPLTLLAWSAGVSALGCLLLKIGRHSSLKG